MNFTEPDSPPCPKLPSTGRILGVDYGSVRIGLAITDSSQTIASPLEVYTRRNEKLDRDYFCKLIAGEQIVGIVVGLPIHLSGDPSPKSQEALAFGKSLAETSQRPVTWIDERFSTTFARDMLNQSQLSGAKRKARLDKLAAQVLLSAFLEANGKTT